MQPIYLESMLILCARLGSDSSQPTRAVARGGRDGTQASFGSTVVDDHMSKEVVVAVVMVVETDLWDSKSGMEETGGRDKGGGGGGGGHETSCS